MNLDRRDRSDGWRKPIAGYKGHKPFSWSVTNPSYSGPFEKRQDQFSEPHIAGYLGHVPTTWTKGQIRSKSATASTKWTTTSNATIGPTMVQTDGFRRFRDGMQGYAGFRPNFPPKDRPKPLPVDD
eukprot:CAMPEP_0169203892 /NCGR_PEP_ID=MMETSP1016-20121227/11706_1 /TAXON_ID=342587 /ORGANISM="Karlodinium micrum, Strain CCMP2283" /LENGTH=125 /DNA_ID=CAMNT_0009280961 /DNA_START=38 /DNA_END=415 /DNA_ORIENTATION=+